MDRDTSHRMNERELDRQVNKLEGDPQRTRERELLGFFAGLTGMVTLVAAIIVIAAVLWIWVF